MLVKVTFIKFHEKYSGSGDTEDTATRSTMRE